MATEEEEKGDDTVPGISAGRGNDPASQIKRKGREKEKRVPLCTTQPLLLIQLNSTQGNRAKSKAFTTKQKRQTEQNDMPVLGPYQAFNFQQSKSFY